MAKQVALIAAVSALVLAALGGVCAFAFHTPRPQTGTVGPAADARARALMAHTAPGAWAKTGAVRFSMGDGQPVHTWDRTRGWVAVEDKGAVVLIRLSDKAGGRVEDGVLLSDADAVDKAWARFINDSFWLNPFRTFFDAGVTRSLVELDDGAQGLLIEYASGGATPGDAYLWRTGKNGVPSAWQMWVNILPIGGIEVSWDKWATFETGARTATHHGALGLGFDMHVETAATLAALDGATAVFTPLERAMR